MDLFLMIPFQVVEHLASLAQKKHCPSLLAVYLALLIHANREGVCFPSYRRLAQVSGVRGKATLARALKILEEGGFLEKSQGKRRSNTYRLFGGNGSMAEQVQFNHGTGGVQSLNRWSSMVELELYPLNYIHLTQSTEQSSCSVFELQNEEPVSRLIAKALQGGKEDAV